MLPESASLQLPAASALAPLADAGLPRFTKVIAVADVVESVRLMRTDEAGFIRRWHAFVEFVRARLPLDSGRVHKSLGDGLMLEFSDAVGCIRAALAMQQWFDAGNHCLPADRKVHLRIGAHLAEFVADEYDIYGNDVNLTARIAGIAGPGEIVVSEALREQVGTCPEVQVEELGPCHLKHIDRPVPAFRLSAPGRMRVPPLQGGTAVRAVVAIVPFSGFANGGEKEPLGEALADELVAALARSSELQLVASPFLAQVAGGRLLLPGGAPALQPHYVLRGRTRCHAGRVALFAELANAATGEVAWTRCHKGELADPVHGDHALPAELAHSIVAAVVRCELALSIGKQLPKLASHTLLLAAIGLMHRRTAADMARARLLLEHLLERHGSEPTASAWLAYWHLLRLQQGTSPDAKDDALRAQRHCLAALYADADCALALCVEGHARLHLHKDLDGAAERFAQVLTAWPDHPMALLFTSEQMALAGDGPAALATARLALARYSLAPMQYLYECTAALAALVAGELRQACHHAERSVRANPRHGAGYRTLAIVQVGLGNLGQARLAVQRLLAQEPDFTLARFVREHPAKAEVLQRQAEALALAGVPH